LEATQKVDKFATQQDFISQQVKANAQVVARLTINQFDKEELLLSDGSMSGSFEDEDAGDFDNVFAKGKNQLKSLSPNHTGLPRTIQLKPLSHITHYPRCNSQPLMVTTPQYGLTIVKTILPSTPS
jgi:hypothetical protein